MKKFKQNFTPTIFNAKLREINVFQITLFSRNISYCMWEKYCLKVINSTWLSTDCWEIVYISPSSEKGAKLQMAIQNAISSKEVKIWLNPKYSFKIEKNSSKLTDFFVPKIGGCWLLWLFEVNLVFVKDVYIVRFMLYPNYHL